MAEQTTITSVRLERVKTTVRVPVSDILALLKSRGFVPASEEFIVNLDIGATGNSTLVLTFLGEEISEDASLYYSPLHPVEIGLGLPPEKSDPQTMNAENWSVPVAADLLRATVDALAESSKRPKRKSKRRRTKK